MSETMEHATGAPVRVMGRPSKFRPELVTEICDRLSRGEPLTLICEDDHMPCDDTVRAWAQNDVSLSRAIARAREAGWDRIAHRGRQTLRGLGPELGGESTGDVNRDRAIADYDLKLLAKWDPKRYGDRKIISGDAEAPLVVETRALSMADVDPEKREVLRELLEQMLASTAVDVTPSGSE